MMRKIIVLLVPLLMAFTFSEVMYDAPGADNNQEFVEILGIIDEHMTFGDASSNDSLVLVQQNISSNVSLIVEEGFDYENLTCNIFVAGATIGDNLGNSGDDLFLWRNGSLVANASYVGGGCSAGGGCSSERNLTGGWQDSHEMGGTPCMPTVWSGSEDSNTTVTNSSGINTTVNATYEGNVSSNESDFINDTINETQEINQTTNKTTDCAYNLSIQLSDEMIDEGTTIKYRPLIDTDQPYAFELVYWWEDLWGDIVKTKTTTTNKNQKSYTPKPPDNEADWVVKLIMELALNCSMNSSRAERLVIVKGMAETADSQDEQEEISSRLSGGTSSATSSSGIYPEKKEEILAADVPEEVFINESFTITVVLNNDGLLDELFMVWAYVYRGSVCYSGEREGNLQDVMVRPGEPTVLELPLTAEAEPGAYKVKVKAIRTGRKTPYEHTEDIDLVAREPSEIIEAKVNQEKLTPRTVSIEGTSESDENHVTGSAVYDAQPKQSLIIKNGAWLGVLFAGLLYGLAVLKKKLWN